MKFNYVNCGLGLLVFGCIATAAHDAYVEKLTREVTTYPGYTNVIWKGNALDSIIHHEGYLVPGKARVSKDARVIEVKDGRQGSLFSTVGQRLIAKDGVKVDPWFRYDYKVLDAKLLIENFSPSWGYEHFYKIIEECVQSQASEHESTSFLDPQDDNSLGADLEKKVNEALALKGVPITVSNMRLQKPFPPIGGSGHGGGGFGLKKNGMLRTHRSPMGR